MPPLQGSPVYAPVAVRFRLGGIPCFAPDGSPLPHAQLAAAARADLLSADAQRAAAGGGGSPGGSPGSASGCAGAGTHSASPPQQQAQQQGWEWVSPEYPVECKDVLQSFPIPPTLCVGGYLRVELLGKRQRQAADEEFYSESGWLAGCMAAWLHGQLYWG
jgi:hypothetical protein